MLRLKDKLPASVLLLSILLYPTLFVSGGATDGLPAALASKVVRVHHRSNEGLELILTAPPFELVDKSLADQTYLSLEVGGLGGGSLPGQPQLPTAGELVALPPGMEAHWNLSQIEVETVILKHPLLPAPTPISPAGEFQTSPVGGAVRYTPDPAIYQADTYFPVEWVTWTPPGRLRGVDVTALHIFPFRYNPVRSELLILRRATLVVTFVPSVPPISASPSAPATMAPPLTEAFTTLLSSASLNFKDIGLDARPSVTDSLLTSPAETWDPGSHAYKIIVNSDGLYRLTYGDLAAAGFPVGGGPDQLNPQTFRLLNRGAELAIWVTGEDDGRFDPGDEIRFVGYAANTRYTTNNVYWLSYGDGPGLRMGIAVATPTGGPAGVLHATAWAEQNTRYEPLYQAGGGDHWYWQKLSAPASADFSLTLQAPDPADAWATLGIRLHGVTAIHTTSPDHHLTVAMNGSSIGDVWWDGATPYTASLTLPSTLLRAGDNVLTLALPGDSGAPIDDVLVDALGLDYALNATDLQAQFFYGLPESDVDYRLGGFSTAEGLLFEVTDPLAVMRLSGTTVTGNGLLTFHHQSGTEAPEFLALTTSQMKSPISIEAAPPFALSKPGNGADYLIISPADFINSLAPLAAHRQSAAGGGYSVKIVDVAQVYDEFSFGLLDPQAIRDFLAYIYDPLNWNPVPTYVLLVGDGTLDFHNYGGAGSQTFIPPYLAMVDSYWGETASDNLYATVDGPDPLADFFIGRLPVNTPLEAETVVNKIIAYETVPAEGLWSGQLLFAADNPDLAGDFYAASDAVYRQYVPPFLGRTVYLGQGYPDGPAAKNALLNAWNQGAGLVAFNGHSSWHQWAVEDLLHINDVPSLVNGGRLPLVLGMTCFTGYFHHPSYDTLDEALVRQSGGGAIATFSATGLGVATGHDWLFQGFFAAVVDGKMAELGPATAAAKLNLYTGSSNPVHRELLDTFLILGDPALRLNLTPPNLSEQVYLPVVSRHR